MESEAAVLAELEQQQQQLEEIEGLLQASPDDPSLLQLKADLLELIAVTTSNISGVDASAIPAPPSGEVGESTAADKTTDAKPHDDSVGKVSGWNAVEETAAASLKRPLEDMTAATSREVYATESSSPLVAATDAVTDEQQQRQPPPKKKKKQSVPKEFVVPPHLQPKDTDSKAEENRKKRAVKALKHQWRAQRKDQEANKKQKSWQDFQSKTKKKSKSKSSGGSMFATSTDAGAKVGVVGGRSMTDFASRKRHK